MHLISVEISQLSISIGTTRPGPTTFTKPFVKVLSFFTDEVNLPPELRTLTLHNIYLCIYLEKWESTKNDERSTVLLSILTNKQAK